MDRFIKKFDKTHIVITATLILFILSGSREDYVKAPITVLCMIPLLFPEFRLSKLLWLSLILIFIVGHIPTLFEMDNFRFIFIYWCLAILMSTFSDDFEGALKFNARLMIGVIFGLAATNKLFSGNYTDGSFFLYSSLTDNRFTRFLGAIHLLPADIANYNWGKFMYMINDAEMPYQTTLRSTSTLDTITKIFTYLVITVEASISLLFLLPKKYRVTKYRDYLLYTFLVVTYSFANVSGFGSIICIMGLAQCDTKRKSFVYILVLLLLQLYRVGIYRVINASDGIF